MLDPKACECGCGSLALAGNRFINGHNRRGCGERDWFVNQGRWYVTTRSADKPMLWSHVVMWDKIGRPVRDGEIVHHKDEDPTNDDPDNLVLYSSHREHMLDAHPQEWAWNMLDAAIRELGLPVVKEYIQNA